ncbi:hypothetical protein Ancab_024022 [Ancistrocladus abbreviatus]
MCDAGIVILDGSQLSDADISLPSFDDKISGSRALELAESRASQSLCGLSLPENLKSSAIKRLNLDDIVSFQGTQLSADQASRLFKDYITAIADELRDDPIVVAILDGKTLKMFLEDEDDFAMLAESLFTDLDRRDEGKLSKSYIHNALDNMGVEMGVPPFPEFPMLDDILKKHGAEGDEKLGQAQFAELLQLVLLDLANALGEKHVIIKQNIKIINGSNLRKLLGNENQLNDVVEKIYQETQEDRNRSCTDIIKLYLEKNGKKLGLPHSGANEAVSLLYDSIFAEIGEKKSARQLEKKEFEELVKEILEKFSEQLEASPIFHEFDD